ncbi:MAG TPA: nucleotide exchange factor GrpE [Fusobacteria bacterium]|nr:nucleotide exchange factor GrpE [Fusobacteriota bacterium]|tara:strand:- start:3621 stop:4112 length:492 start_codon:yes stop_codon:yes gene_type:complete
MKKAKKEREEKREESELEELKSKVSELENSLKEKDSEYVVKLAELDNARKRLEKEFQRQRDLANEKVILSFLDILDNLELALQSDGDIKEGVKMILNQFINTLNGFGVSVIEEQYFNPELHHAVAIEDGEQSSMEEIRKGYVLNGKVIRPALVKLTNKGGSNE